jgi:hypothetical protein
MRNPALSPRHCWLWLLALDVVLSQREQSLLQSSARPIWWPGLFSVQRDGTNQRQLVKIDSPFFVSKERFAREPLSPPHRLLHVPQRQDEDVIVAEHTYTSAGQPVGTIAKRLNIVTGRATSLSLGVPGPARNWLFDPAGEPRLVTTFKEGRTTVHWRGPGQADWRVLSEHPQHEAPFTPLYVDAKGGLYVTMPHPRTGHRVLTTFDFQTGKPSPTTRSARRASTSTVTWWPKSMVGGLGCAAGSGCRDDGVVRCAPEGLAGRGRSPVAWPRQPHHLPAL